jgi:hypothetical protein
MILRLMDQRQPPAAEHGLFQRLFNWNVVAVAAISGTAAALELAAAAAGAERFGRWGHGRSPPVRMMGHGKSSGPVEFVRLRPQ